MGEPIPPPKPPQSYEFPENLAPEELQALQRELENDLLAQDEETLKQALEYRRENTRSYLAWSLMGILAGIYLFFGIIITLTIFTPSPSESDRNQKMIYTKDMMALILSAQTALVGTVLGFYFGTVQQDRD